MGIMSINDEIKIKLISIVPTEHGIGRVILEVSRQLCDGPCYIGNKITKSIQLDTGQEITLC
jgi:hypothetical protein